VLFHQPLKWHNDALAVVVLHPNFQATIEVTFQPGAVEIGGRRSRPRHPKTA
jgi:hypothetical protein